jgi:type II secretory pathway component PulJ
MTITRKRAACSDAFTLIEVIISLSLTVIVLGCAYACLSAGYSAQKLIEPRVDVLQTARVALEVITGDLRSACLLPGGADFLGMKRNLGEVEADNIDFATHNYTPTLPQEGDFCEVSFFLDKNSQTGQLSLWRRKNPMIAMDPLSGGRREELATDVQGLQFEYFDGFDWYKTWGDTDGRGKQETSSKFHSNLSGLPEAVRITLLLAPATNATKTNAPGGIEPPMVFRTVARLNLSSSSLAANTSSTESPQNSAPTPSVPGVSNPGGAP